jgi:hypothetical protein
LGNVTKKKNNNETATFLGSMPSSILQRAWGVLLHRYGTSNVKATKKISQETVGDLFRNSYWQQMHFQI